MIKRICTVIILDMSLLIATSFVIVTKGEATHICNADLFWAGLQISIYNLFFVLRNVIICSAAYFKMNPLLKSNISRLFFVLFDCAFYTAIVILVTIKFIGDESQHCKSTVKEAEVYWYMVLVLIIIGYFQVLLDWVLCIITSVACCYICCYINRLRREERDEALA